VLWSTSNRAGPTCIHMMACLSPKDSWLGFLVGSVTNHRDCFTHNLASQNRHRIVPRKMHCGSRESLSLYLGIHRTGIGKSSMPTRSSSTHKVCHANYRSNLQFYAPPTTQNPKSKKPTTERIWHGAPALAPGKEEVLCCYLGHLSI
jgi:hypothetical protein